MVKKAVNTSKSKSKKSASWVIAKLPDGEIQITYTIPSETIEESRKAVLSKYAKTVTVPGFRKGKAPAARIADHIDPNTFVQETLSGILPALLGDTLKKEKLTIAVYPRFELVGAKEGEPWQIRAITSEVPQLELGDYKAILQGEVASKSLWTPSQGKPEQKKPITQEEKEQLVINALVKNTKIKISNFLLQEEVNGRLARLLERIEKLGLSLDSYLNSIGKTAEQLRASYAEEAKGAVTLDLALIQIAQKEGITVDEKVADEAVKAASGDPKMTEKLNTPQQRRLIRNILVKRATLAKLTSYL